MSLFGIPLNIPNLLSLYRLLSFPFIMAFVYLGYESLFVTLFVINQITDILDGYIARKFNLQTAVGSLLDSYADIGSYVIAIYGIITFRPELFEVPYRYWLFTFLFCYVSQIGICLLKFKRMAIGLHLYANKVTGYVQGSFLVVLFAYQLVEPFFYVMIVVGILAEIECLAITLLISSPIKNAKGLFWIIKNKQIPSL